MWHRILRPGLLLLEVSMNRCLVGIDIVPSTKCLSDVEVMCCCVEWSFECPQKRNSVAIFWHSQGSHPSERTACYGTWGVSTCTQSAAILRPEGLRNGTMNTSGVIIHQEYISVIYVISSGSWIDGNNLS